MNKKAVRTNLYLMVGLVISMSLSLLAFEWRTFRYSVRELVAVQDSEEIVEIRNVKIVEEKKQASPSKFLKPVPDVPVLTDDLKPVDKPDEEVTPAGPTGPEKNPNIFSLDDEEVGDDEEGVVDYSVLSDFPVFPGCEKSRTRDEFLECFSSGVTAFISRHYKVPESCKSWGVSGRIAVRFVLGKNGKVESATVVKGIMGDCDKEAERVVKMLPEMIPGKQAGHAVRTSFVVPIRLDIR